MNRTLCLATILLAALSACSGYDGGGDVRLAPIADGGSTPVTDSGARPDAQPPRDSGVPPEVPEESTVLAYYPLDGHLNDQSPSSSPKLDLQMQNGSFISGLVGSSLSVSNAGYAAARPQIDDAFSFGSKDFTIQAWIAGGPVAIGLGTRALGTPASDGWLLYATQSSVAFTTNDPRGGLAFPMPSANDFRHIVVRRASGLLTIFVNGSVKASREDWPAIGPERELGILRHPTGTNGTPARIDEIVIWSRALSDAEIQELRNRGSSGQAANPDE